MCRRCGEPDRRGGSNSIAARRLWLVSPDSLFGGDGLTVPCWGCAHPLSLESNTYTAAGVLAIRMEVDRIIPGYQCVTCTAAGLKVVRRYHDDAVRGHAFKGGTYRRNNIRPSCPGCNTGRNVGNPWGHKNDPSETRCYTR